MNSARMAIMREAMRDLIRIHLNFFHTMNLSVLHGFMNQRNEVSGRLFGRRENNTCCVNLHCLVWTG